MNEAFCEYWEKQTLKKLMKKDGEKWYCATCPLLAELRGVSAEGSLFVGLTVSSCDFRGKRIGADDVLGSAVTNEAYEEHDPKQMLAFAQMLESLIEECREEGDLEKDSYEKYSKEYDESQWMQAFEAKMTPEEYEKSMHWREENLRDAVRWLRTCARLGVHMGVSY